jgi:hypothetical protein
MIELLKEKGGVLSGPKIILSDFEPAAINAFKQHYLSAVFKGCHFHYTQAIWRNIQDNGLAKLYTSNPLVYNWLRMFYGIKTHFKFIIVVVSIKRLIIILISLYLALPFLHPQIVSNALDLLVMHLPSANGIQEFADYFRATWLEGRFDVHLWIHFNDIGPRTNNHLEGFNAKLNKYFNFSKTNIYIFILCIKDIETEIEKSYIDLLHGLTLKKRRSIDIK